MSGFSSKNSRDKTKISSLTNAFFVRLICRRLNTIHHAISAKYGRARPLAAPALHKCCAVSWPRPSRPWNWKAQGARAGLRRRALSPPPCRAAIARAASVLLLIALPAASPAETPRADPAFAERLPRAWCGVFRWDNETREQHVTIRFDRVAARADGTIEADGPGLVRYEDEPPAQAVPFHMRAVVDPWTWRIEMFESIERPRADYVVDGSHVGTLAADLQSLAAVWTTRSTGRLGRLRMNARPVAADLAQPCAPPSSRAPSPPLHNASRDLAESARGVTFAMN